MECLDIDAVFKSKGFQSARAGLAHQRPINLRYRCGCIERQSVETQIGEPRLQLIRYLRPIIIIVNDLLPRRITELAKKA